MHPPFFLIRVFFIFLDNNGYILLFQLFIIVKASSVVFPLLLLKGSRIRITVDHLHVPFVLSQSLCIKVNLRVLLDPLPLSTISVPLLVLRLVPLRIQVNTADQSYVLVIVKIGSAYWKHHLSSMILIVLEASE